MRILLFIFFIFLLSGKLFAQDRKLLHGKITVPDSLLSNSINIININTLQGTTNGALGSFEIKAKSGDSLFFSALPYQKLKLKVTPEMLDIGYLEISLKRSVNQLAEVQLSNIKLSGVLASDMGRQKTMNVYPMGAPAKPRLTQTERRLYTATAGPKTFMEITLSILTGNIPLDPWINGLTGRTKKLKELNANAVDKALVEKAKFSMPPNYFHENLNIADTLLEEFFYYCVRNPNFKSLLKKENGLKRTVFFKEKAAEFLNSKTPMLEEEALKTPNYDN